MHKFLLIALLLVPLCTSSNEFTFEEGSSKPIQTDYDIDSFDAFNEFDTLTASQIDYLHETVVDEKHWLNNYFVLLGSMRDSLHVLAIRLKSLGFKLDSTWTALAQPKHDLYTRGVVGCSNTFAFDIVTSIIGEFFKLLEIPNSSRSLSPMDDMIIIEQQFSSLHSSGLQCIVKFVSNDVSSFTGYIPAQPNDTSPFSKYKSQNVSPFDGYPRPVQEDSANKRSKKENGSSPFYVARKKDFKTKCTVPRGRKKKGPKLDHPSMAFLFSLYRSLCDVPREFIDEHITFEMMQYLAQRVLQEHIPKKGAPIHKHYLIKDARLSELSTAACPEHWKTPNEWRPYVVLLNFFRNAYEGRNNESIPELCMWIWSLYSMLPQCTDDTALFIYIAQIGMLYEKANPSNLVEVLPLRDSPSPTQIAIGRLCAVHFSIDHTPLVGGKKLYPQNIFRAICTLFKIINDRLIRGEEVSPIMRRFAESSTTLDLSSATGLMVQVAKLLGFSKRSNFAVQIEELSKLLWKEVNVHPESLRSPGLIYIDESGLPQAVP